MEEKYRGRIISLILIALIILTLNFSNKMVISIIIIILLYGGICYDRISDLYKRDPLTNVYNRRFAHEFLPVLFKKANRKNRRVSIIFIDINGFKKVNDSYGHLMGDNILIKLSEIFQMNIRSSDKVVRWGGDEFLLIIPDCSNKDLNKIIERLYREIELLSPKLGIDLSITIGTSTFPDDGLRMDDLINKADVNMYSSKGKELVRELF